MSTLISFLPPFPETSGFPRVVVVDAAAVIVDGCRVGGGSTVGVVHIGVKKYERRRRSDGVRVPRYNFFTLAYTCTHTPTCTHTHAHTHKHTQTHTGKQGL